jgi:hypothetical protein
MRILAVSSNKLGGNMSPLCRFLSIFLIDSIQPNYAGRLTNDMCQTPLRRVDRASVDPHIQRYLEQKAELNDQDIIINL